MPSLLAVSVHPMQLTPGAPARPVYHDCPVRWTRLQPDHSRIHASGTSGGGNRLTTKTPRNIKTPEDRKFLSSKTKNSSGVSGGRLLGASWCLGGRPLLLRNCSMVALTTQFLGRIPVGDRTGNVRRRDVGNGLPPRHQETRRHQVLLFLSSWCFLVSWWYW